MPKIYLAHQKRKWLELSEKGKSEKWIANNAKCDYRTIRKGIEEARRERNAIAAQIELVKEALTDHKDQLLAVLDGMRSMVVMPPDNLEIRTERNGRIAPIPLTGIRVRSDETGSLVLDVHAEEEVAWELLQEHLKGDKLWKSYREWKETLVAHLEARIDLKSEAAKLIEETTGLVIRDKVSGGRMPYISPAAVQVFYELALRQALKRIDGTNLEERLTASDDGYVRLGSEFAYAPDGPQECRDQLIVALKSLYLSPMVNEIAASYNRLQEATAETGRIIDEIALLSMLTGSCRVCRRLGIK